MNPTTPPAGDGGNADEPVQLPVSDSASDTGSEALQVLVQASGTPTEADASDQVPTVVAAASEASVVDRLDSEWSRAECHMNVRFF
jgi:hypothetical protein